MNQVSFLHALTNIVLVFIESALTLVLRFDPELRKAAYPLAKEGTVVCLRLYLPHVQLYATFSYKGVLLDTELPPDRSEADVTINAYSAQIINAMLSSQQKQVRKLQMRGEAVQVQLVQQFLQQLGMGSLIQSLRDKFTRKPADNDSAPSKEERQAYYKKKLEQQQTQINELTIDNRKLQTQLKQYQSQQKTWMIVALVTSILAVVCLLGWLFG